MPAPIEVASLDQVIQIGQEVTPGTPVAATRKLGTLTTFDPTPVIDVDMSQRGIGQKAALFGIVGKETTTISIAGPMTFDDWIYPWNLCLKTFVISAGGDATTKYHTGALSQTAQETYSAATLEHGDSVRAHKIAGVQMPDLSFTLDLRSNTAQWSGGLIGYALADAIALTGALTTVTGTPMAPKNTDVFLDATWGTLGTTKLTRVLKVDFSISGHWSQFFTLNNTVGGSPTGTIEMAPAVQCKITLATNAAGMALLPIMRLGTKQFLRIANTGPVAGSSTQNFRLDMAGQISDFGTLKDENGIVGAEITLDMVYDITGASNLVVRLENLLTALS